MCVCVCAELTCVRDEADFEEGADHGGHVAGLVVAQSPPLGNHQCVHGNTHVSIAGEVGEEGGRGGGGGGGGVSIACSLPAGGVEGTCPALCSSSLPPWPPAEEFAGM